MAPSWRSLARLPQALAPCLVGLAAFLLVVGPFVLAPTNIGWLRDGADTATMYLGWAFFRHGPWMLPLGLNPRYGLELGSAILYSDSIPLLALLLKPVSPWLPEPFQYFGVWLLVAFVLQSLFAWLLLGTVTRHPWLRVLASILFVFAPPVLFRLAGHWALFGQWPILAALFLLFRASRRRQAFWWVLLVTCSALVHTYLFVMVVSLWVSAWVGDAWTRRRDLQALATEAVLTPSCAVVALWQAGLFVVSDGKGKAGFGLFRMNLNSLMNAYGWSYVLPTLETKQLDYEGFAFLGLGALGIAGLAVPAFFALLRRRELPFRREWVPLVLVCLGLTVMAASNQVGFGLHGFNYPLPSALEGATSMLRASGRLVWPAFYVLLLAILALVIRWYPRRLAVLVIAVAAVAQAVDTSAGWRVYQPRFHRRAAVRTELTSGFWYEAPTVYRRVRLVPPGNVMPNWAVFAEYAQSHGLATDAVYAARVDMNRATELQRRTADMLRDGTFDRESLYILQAGTARRVPCVVDPDRDQLSFINGYWVLMPQWKARFGDRFAGQLRLNCPVLEHDGDSVEFVTGSDAASMLTEGWSMPESWGTWSEGARSEVSVRVRGRVSAVEFGVTAATRPGPPLEVRVSVNGRQVDVWRMPPSEDLRWFRVPLPAAGSSPSRLNRIEFAYSDTRSPASLGGSNDARPIALALRRARARE